MNRRQAIRNSLLALAASLVPRILQPVMPEFQGDKLSIVRYTKKNTETNKIIWERIMWVRKEDADDCLYELRKESEKYT